MKKLLIPLLLNLTVFVFCNAQNKYTKCNNEAVYTVEGILLNSSSKYPIIRQTGGEIPRVGDVGEILKYFEETLGKAVMSGWLVIGTIEIVSVTGDKIKAKVLKEHSTMTINGKKKSHFVKGKVVKFLKYEYENEKKDEPSHEY